MTFFNDARLWWRTLSAAFALAVVAFASSACAGASGNVTLPTVAAPTYVAATAAPAASFTSTAASSSTADSSGDLVRLVMVPDGSQARYRVREQLANISLPSDAVGATNAITGTIVGKRDGSIVSSESKFTVGLSTLKSDRDQRDNFLRRNVLQTDQYPNAVFVPNQAPGLPLTLAASGDIQFQLIGDLTIRNVTKPVTWDVKGHVQGDDATGTATTAFKFEYFDLTQPRVPLVLSIVDNIALELDLHLRRLNN